MSAGRLAGGAHVVDDAGVETPGVCHLGTWLSPHNTQSGLLNLAPACTFEALPQVEFGASISTDMGLISRDLSVMGEAFTRDDGRPGAQVGLRWNPGHGNIDVDLLSGWQTDGVTPWTITLGITVRR